MSERAIQKGFTYVNWQAYIASIKTFSVFRRICLYPYTWLMASLAERYGKAADKWERENEKSIGKPMNWYGSLLGSQKLYAETLCKQRHERFLREFDACCDMQARYPTRDLFIDQARDIGRFFRALTRPPLRNNLFAIPFAAVSMLFIVFLRLFAELFLAGKSKDFLISLYESASSNQAERFNDPREIQDMAVQTKPVMMLGLYAAPITAVMLITKQLITDTVGLFWTKHEKLPADCLRFRQNIDRSKESGPAAFYFSPVFGWTMLFVFASGIPAFIPFWLYTHFGVDALLGYPSHDPEFFKVFCVIDLYIYSLGWCLASLFFVGYFTYLCNFTSTEYDIEIYPDLIKQFPIKGWATGIFMFPLTHALRRLFWRDVQTVKFTSSKASLKAIVNRTDNPLWKVFAKLDSLYENLWRKMDIHNEYLQIATAKETIDIRLWELTRKELAQLFYCLRKYAPSIYLDSSVQEALVGSTVLQDPRYTEIWFNLLTRHDQLESEQSLATGSQLREGKFTVNKKLLSGGQANIYLAHDNAGMTVILKEFQLTPGESLDSLVESAAAFESESTILSQLDHPHIVKLYDLFIQGSRVYLALEHVEGQTLRELVKEQGPLDEATALDLLKQMCDVLEYLHARTPAIVHRDFTPDNLIRQKDGKLKLIDFSVAQGQKKERTNCAGKHAYTPPEQFRGEACPQSDIYALGATMYFLLTGKDPQPISNLVVKDEKPEISDRLNSIIDLCTKLNLEDRYESVAWIKTEIESNILCLCYQNRRQSQNASCELWH